MDGTDEECTPDEQPETNYEQEFKTFMKQLTFWEAAPENQGQEGRKELLNKIGNYVDLILKPELVDEILEAPVQRMVEEAVEETVKEMAEESKAKTLEEQGMP